MAVGLGTAMVVGAVATLAAGGLAYYSSQEQAATAQQVAAYNAEIQRQQADLNAQMQIRQSEINQSMLQSQLNQTAALDNQAESIEAHGREEQRRLREERLRMMGAQTAGFAKGGVVTEGTPLAVFAETDYNFALQEMDIFKSSSEQADAIRRGAAMERHDIGTQMEIEKLNVEAAKAGKAIGYSSAAMTTAQGAATARAYRLSGYGSLLGAGSSVSGRYADYKMRVN